MIRKEEMLVRTDVQGNLVQELQREPQVTAAIQGFREIYKVAVNVGVAVSNSYDSRRPRDLHHNSSRIYTTKAVTALNFYGHSSPR